MDLYCSIALDWDYVNRTVAISMLGYIKKKIQEYGHLVPNRMQKCPYLPKLKKMVWQHRLPSHPMIHQNWMQRVLNVSNKLWAAFCTMHLALLPLSKQRQLKKLWKDAYNCLITLPPMKRQR
jgi:hypothetical protein